MSQLDFTTALARLLSDADLRGEFAVDPAGVAQRLTDHADDASALAAISPAQLDSQAAGLVRKRAGQVASLLPLTWGLLDDASERFAEFAAQDPWPEGHQRHSRDAIAFGRWLLDNGNPALVRSEWKRLRFRLQDRRFGLCLVSHPSIPLRSRGLRLQWKRGDRVIVWQIWLPLFTW